MREKLRLLIHLEGYSYDVLHLVEVVVILTRSDVVFGVYLGWFVVLQRVVVVSFASCVIYLVMLSVL